MTNILTLQMDEPSKAWFEGLRQAHYPAHLNQIEAHLTLFHTLPDTAEVEEAVRVSAEERSPFEMQVAGLRSLGRGVAFQVTSRRLLDLQTELAEAFREHLSAQDRQRFVPHVVVQNKATPERAKALLAKLQAEFVPRRVEALGLQLWHYLGGPWELAETFPFSERDKEKSRSSHFAEE